jgi:broad specificity phosphatase PhoE
VAVAFLLPPPHAATSADHPAPATTRAADDQARLWQMLRDGGRIVLLRHAPTTPGYGDPDNFRLGDCSTQRNLSDAGRDSARQIGAAFRARGVPIGRVLSSQWCRCLDTARLAFDRVDEEPVLNSFLSEPAEQRDRQTAALHERLSGKPEDGVNDVLVTHQVNITAVADVIPAMGEALVVTPTGEGFRIEGQLRAWVAPR